jgi:hypothetical protein
MIEFMSKLLVFTLSAAIVARAQTKPILHDVRSLRSVCVPNDSGRGVSAFKLEKDILSGEIADRADALAEAFERAFRRHLMDSGIRIVTVQDEEEDKGCSARLEGTVSIERRTLDPLTYKITLFIAITNNAKYEFEFNRFDKIGVWQTRLDRIFYYPWRAATVEKYASLLAERFAASRRGLLQADPAPPAQQRLHLDPSMKISFTGIGPVKIGMSVAQVRRVLADRIVSEPGDGNCSGLELPDVEGLSFMMLNGRVARVEVNGGLWQTVSGARVGLSERQLRLLYNGLANEQGSFGSYWLLRPTSQLRKSHGMIFVTDGKTITSFRSGLLEAVALEEGCL